RPRLGAARRRQGRPPAVTTRGGGFEPGFAGQTPDAFGAQTVQRGQVSGHERAALTDGPPVLIGVVDACAGAAALADLRADTGPRSGEAACGHRRRAPRHGAEGREEVLDRLSALA